MIVIKLLFLCFLMFYSFIHFIHMGVHTVTHMSVSAHTHILTEKMQRGCVEIKEPEGTETLPDCLCTELCIQFRDKNTEVGTIFNSPERVPKVSFQTKKATQNSKIQTAIWIRKESFGNTPTSRCQRPSKETNTNVFENCHSINYYFLVHGTVNIKYIQER